MIWPISRAYHMDHMIYNPYDWRFLSFHLDLLNYVKQRQIQFDTGATIFQFR